MERADLVPLGRVSGKVARRSLGPVGADGSEARAVGSELAVGVLVLDGRDQREQRLDQFIGTKLEEHPAAFLSAGDQPCVGEDLEVPADPRLALPENLCELTDRQLHLAQERKQAEPARIGKGLE
jgi:hypothetical protein